ncbi:subtilisin inhibitor-like [Murinocardiopsis flavida]|uniref:Subtilisin inhibitor-like n=1 Tax=Murinocardiopsis flavida TaxID=645275 RepID=A0A2P8DQ76_9ACTN|nr:SSI family serine proteinase inhibitor [Murinocardiopsis flavida]PSK99338.1 subtilisin inhibitor-like [Murinocardiopsis flavida]
MRTYSRTTALVPAAALAALGFLAGGCGNGAGEVADAPGPAESASESPGSAAPSESPTESATDAPGKGEPSKSPDDGGSAAKTDLTIDIKVDDAEQGAGAAVKPATWTLTCSPVGGDHPDPKAACAKLDKVGTKGFAPVPENKPCTQIMGGPEVAKVTGRLDGDKIDTEFTKAGGCELNRYKEMGSVLAP